MSGPKKYFGYALYAAAVFVLLLYLLFPAEAVKNRLEQTLARAFPGLRIAVGTVSPAFPPGLRLTDVAVTYQGMALTTVDRMTVWPGWRTLLMKKAVAFRVTALEGSTAGAIRWDNSGLMTARGRIADIRLALLPVLRDLAEADLSGTLDGTFSLTADPADGLSGETTFHVSDCVLVPSSLPVDIDQLRFETVTVAAALENRRALIRESVFRGPDLNADITGELRFENPLPASDISLDIHVTPHRVLLAKLSQTLPAGLLNGPGNDGDGFHLIVTGRWEAPRVAFGGLR